MKKILGVVVVSLLAFVVVGLFLDREWKVERELVMDASPAEVHSYVADLRTWPDWTAWSRDRDPDCVWTYSGSDFGEGMKYSWQGEELGIGHLTLTSASVGEGVDFDLVFGVTEGEGELAQGKFTYEVVEGGTEVSWTFSGEVPGVFGGWFALFMDTLAGGEFEKGLVSLKGHSEGGSNLRLEQGVKEVLNGL